MRTVTSIILLIPALCFGQDTLDMQLASRIQGINLMMASGDLIASQNKHIEVDSPNNDMIFSLQLYDLAEPRHPGLIEDVFRLVSYQPHFEISYDSYQTSAVIRDSLLIGLLYNACGFGSDNPGVIYGPISLNAHVIGTDRSLWEIVLIDSLAMWGNPDSVNLYDDFVPPKTLALAGDYLIVAAGTLGILFYDILRGAFYSELAQAA